MHYQLINCLFQDDLSKKESQLADLQENIKSQQAETSKAKDELTSALAAMEKQGKFQEGVGGLGHRENHIAKES